VLVEFSDHRYFNSDIIMMFLLFVILCLYPARSCTSKIFLESEAGGH